jgi:hypothetical protein
MVVVYPARRLRQIAASTVAHVVVEHYNARRAERIPQQALHFGIVHRLDLVRIIEVVDRGRRLDQREAVAIQGELRLAASRAFDSHHVRIVNAVPHRHAGRRFHHVARRPFRRALQIMQFPPSSSAGASGRISSGMVAISCWTSAVR